MKVARDGSLVVTIEIGVLNLKAVEECDEKLLAVGLHLVAVEVELDQVVRAWRGRVDGELGERGDGQLGVALGAGSNELG